ncbi:MAG TPA: ribosome assembly cofactor RimP [Parafilimonas sp.]|nr:ribosome assembly cofactor RimP [Parafilimonas sp.]
METILQKTEALVTKLLSQEPEYFLVEIKIKPTNNIKVYIDGDKGISIEKCVYFNRQLYKKIEDAGMFPSGDFSLEVSSPGVDKPLKLHRQYLKNIGRNIEVTFNDGSKKEGKLLQATNDDIILEQVNGKGKKAETQQLVIPFSNIKTTTVQIQF